MQESFRWRGSHAAMKISVEGGDPESARTVVVLLHGGGASALDFLGLSQEFPADEQLCWLAPQALQSRWFPGELSDSRSGKEPYLTVSAKSVLGLLERHTSQRIILAGFLDGAGVVGELLADPELPSAVAGAWMASGAMVGPEEHWPERPKISIPVLLSGQRDSTEASARYLQAAGATVTRHHTEGAGIDAEELALAQRLIMGAR